MRDDNRSRSRSRRCCRYPDLAIVVIEHLMMETRLSVVRETIRRRNELASEICHVLDRTKARPTLMFAQSLISAIARSISEESPDSVCEWVRITRPDYERFAISAMVDVACDRILAQCERAEVDHSPLIVLLEIIKSQSCSQLTSDADRHSSREDRPSEVVNGILAMLELRDEATCTHSRATAAWSRRLAMALALPPSSVEVIGQAGLLHDIGKIATPDTILAKTGSLDHEEWIEMHKHAAHGADILRELPSLARCATIVRAHHERIDGRGYPDGLVGDQIPFEARVVAVADAFDAMITARPYRAPIPQREALEILRDGTGTQWDPRVVNAMLAVLKQPRARETQAAANH